MYTITSVLKPICLYHFSSDQPSKTVLGRNGGTCTGRENTLRRMTYNYTLDKMRHFRDWFQFVYETTCVQFLITDWFSRHFKGVRLYRSVLTMSEPNVIVASLTLYYYGPWRNVRVSVFQQYLNDKKYNNKHMTRKERIERKYHGTTIEVTKWQLVLV